MATTDRRLEALLELERRGALTREASQLLSAYRAQGVPKTVPLGPNGQVAPQNPARFETSKARDDARKAMDTIERLQPQIDRVRQLYEQSLKGSGPLRSLREYLPSPAHAQFDNAAATLRLLARPSTRTPGEGAMSDFDAKLAVAPMPDRWRFDSGNEEALRGLQTIVDGARDTYGKRLGLPDAPPSAKRNGAWTVTKD